MNVKNILLVNTQLDKLENEISFLKEMDFNLFLAWNRSEALKILEKNNSAIDFALTDPVLETLEDGLNLAGKIISDFDIPLAFYTEKSEKEVISRTDVFDHYGIITISSGTAVLLSSIIRVSKAISRYKELQPEANPINRLVNRIKDSNKINEKSDYGYLTKELVDAVIIDDSEGNIIIANNKACQILGLTMDQIKSNYIYESQWKFIHEDYSPFPPDEHPHITSRKTGETVKNIIMGIERPGEKIQWLSNSSLAIFSSDRKSLAGVATYFYDITDLIDAKKDNFRWTYVFQSAGWGIVVGEADSKTLDLMNPAYARMHGYTVSELQGKPIMDVFAPEEREYVKNQIKIAHNKGHYRFIATHIRKDGTRFPAMQEVTTIKDKNKHILFRAVSVTDITDQKAQELTLKKSLEEKENLLKKLEKEKEYSDTLFYNSPIAIYSVTNEGKIVNINKKGEEITGYEKGELIGKEFDIFVQTPANIPLLGNEFRIKTRDNIEKIIEKYSAPILDSTGNVKGEIESFIDITAWKELENFKQDIEKIIRHDLKTPLNSIIGFPKLMLTDESISDEYREYLMIILLAGQNMLNLINASLNMYKIEEGTYQYHFEKTNVILILNQIKHILKVNYKNQQCQIAMYYNTKPIKEKMTLEINTEKSLFTMILMNLIKNAVEASPHGEIISIHLNQGENLTITINNKGIIPEDIRNRFFEKYVTQGKTGGNGLGTYSAKLMANAINADLHFKSDKIEGTTLFLTL